jgi:hypothetical protein
MQAMNRLEEVCMTLRLLRPVVVCAMSAGAISGCQTPHDAAGLTDASTSQPAVDREPDTLLRMPHPFTGKQIDLGEPHVEDDSPGNWAGLNFTKPPEHALEE